MRSTAQDGSAEDGADPGGDEPGADRSAAGHVSDNDVLLSALGDRGRFDQVLEYRARRHAQEMERIGAETEAYERRTSADADALRRVETSRAQQQRRTVIVLGLILPCLAVCGLPVAVLVELSHHRALLPLGTVGSCVATVLVGVVVPACVAGRRRPPLQRIVASLTRSAGGARDDVSGPTSRSTADGSGTSPAASEHTATPAAGPSSPRSHDRPGRNSGPDQPSEPG
ncbi:hypothetical protein [Streptomyces sp. CA2R106]|uniref:hypothetical protein n=1 Tax=Streptomyces sp. CA2R106 TaxID=3120153 RepID=UPI0030099268